MGPSAVLQELRKRWFIVALLVVITLAKIYPPLGAKGGKDHDCLREGTKWEPQRVLLIAGNFI